MGRAGSVPALPRSNPQTQPISRTTPPTPTKQTHPPTHHHPHHLSPSSHGPSPSPGPSRHPPPREPLLKVPPRLQHHLRLLLGVGLALADALERPPIHLARALRSAAGPLLHGAECSGGMTVSARRRLKRGAHIAHAYRSAAGPPPQAARNPWQRVRWDQAGTECLRLRSHARALPPSPLPLIIQLCFHLSPPRPPPPPAPAPLSQMLSAPRPLPAPRPQHQDLVHVAAGTPQSSRTTATPARAVRACMRVSMFACMRACVQACGTAPETLFVAGACSHSY